MRAFTYERASSVEAAAKAAASNPETKFIAGGTNLLDLMKLEIETPTHLIDINGVGLDKIESTPEGGLRIGALVRNTDLAAHETVRRDYGLLSRALVAGAPGNCATKRRRPATFCSARAVLISMTRTSRATSGSQAAAVPQSAASVASMQWSG